MTNTIKIIYHLACVTAGYAHIIEVFLRETERIPPRTVQGGNKRERIKYAAYGNCKHID